MKAWICLLVLTASLLAFPLSAGAAKVGIGASLWCAWWDFSGAQNAGLFGGAGKELKPAPAGGPILAVSFNETWGLTLAYMYGKFESRSTSLNLLLMPLTRFPIPTATTIENERHDLDFIVSASVHRYVKLFFGAKYWGQMLDTSTGLLFLSMRSRNDAHFGGAGFGAGCTLPLGAGFFVLPNASGVCLAGTLSRSGGGPLGAIPAGISGSVQGGPILYFGVNSTLALAYRFEKADVTLSLGGRFQYLWIYAIDPGKLMKGNDLFAGATFSVVYAFDCGGTPAR